MKFFAPFFKNKTGSTAIEYGLIAGLISIVIIGTMISIGSTMETIYTELIFAYLKNV